MFAAVGRLENPDKKAGRLIKMWSLWLPGVNILPPNSYNNNMSAVVTPIINFMLLCHPCVLFIFILFHLIHFLSTVCLLFIVILGDICPSCFSKHAARIYYWTFLVELAPSGCERPARAAKGLMNGCQLGFISRSLYKCLTFPCKRAVSK